MLGKMGGASGLRGFAGGGSTWTSKDETWNSLSPFQRAAAMALMEADGRDPTAARNALGAMINRAMKSGEELGTHVGRSIYQPAIEPAQQARLRSIVGSDDFGSLTQWAADRHAGKVADPVNGATHFLAPEKTMLDLEARDPEKYKNWGPRGANWTGYDPATGEYKGVVLRDSSHAFLAPEGRYEGNPGAPQPPDGMDAATYGSPSGLRPASGSMTASLPAPYAGDSSPSGGISDLIKAFSQGGSKSGGGNSPQAKAPPQQEDDTAALRSTQDSLAKLMASLEAPRKAFDRGGAVEWLDGQPQFSSDTDAPMMEAGASRLPDRGAINGTPMSAIGTPYEAAPTRSALSVPTSSRDIISTDQPQEKSWLGKVWDEMREPGIYAGKAPTKWQMFANELQSTPSPTMRGPGEGKAAAFSKMVDNQMEQQRINNSLAQVMAQLTGKMPDGTLTMEGKKIDPGIAHTNAQTKLLDVEAIAKDPRIAGAKMILAQKVMNGEPVTQDDINSAYGIASSGKLNGATPSELPPSTESKPSAAAPSSSGASSAVSAAPTTSAGGAPASGIPNATPRAYSPAAVPQGGDPTARVNRPNAAPATTTQRPYMTEEDKNFSLLHMLAPELRASLEKNPGFQGRVEEAKLRAKRNIETEEKQTQGKELERQINELEERMVKAGPEILNYATGPYLSDPNWQKRLALIPFTGGEGSVLNQAQILNTKVQHTIDALSTQYSALSGGKVTSDAARAELKSAVGEAFKARGPAGVFEILHDAKRNIQGLAHLPIDPLREDYYPEQWRKPEAKPKAAPSEAVSASGPPPSAVQELLANPDSPEHIESFNKHFNGGKPGLAERMIWDGAKSKQLGVTPKGEDYAPHNILRRIIGLPPI
jgi:hypothetical protein